MTESANSGGAHWSCTPLSRQAEIWDCWDREFILDKKRPPLLRDRFRRLWAAQGKAVLCKLSLRGEVRAACLLEKTCLIHGSTRHWGWQVGFVWCDREYRGAGLGSELISKVRDVYAADSSFVMLHASRQSFYQRLGFVLQDNSCSTLWHRKAAGWRGSVDGSIQRESATGIFNRSEALRDKQTGWRVDRTELHYATVPIPAETTGALIHADGWYALFGIKEKRAYLYEIMAPAKLWPAFWASLSEEFDEVYINESFGSGHMEWCVRNLGVEFESNALTHWFSCNAKMEALACISWFDRI